MEGRKRRRKKIDRERGWISGEGIENGDEERTRSWNEKLEREAYRGSEGQKGEKRQNDSSSSLPSAWKASTSIFTTSGVTDANHRVFHQIATMRL